MAENLKSLTAVRPLVFCGLLIEASLLALYAIPPGGGSVVGFIVVHGALFAVVAVLWFRRGTMLTAAPAVTRAAILAFAVLFRLTMLPHLPVCSDDIERYLWDGKVIVHGINPYAYAPNDPRLAALASNDLPAKVNHPSLGTVYPPLAEAFFAGAYLLFGESVVGLKALLVLCDVCGVILLGWLLRRAGRSDVGVLLYAWSPLPILYGALDGHVDILGVPFLALLIAGMMNGRHLRSAVAAAAGALVKLHPIILAPLYLRSRPWRKGLTAALLALLLFVVAYLPFAGSLGEELRWLTVFGQNWEFNGGIFSVVFAFLNDNQKAHVVMNVLLAAWILWLTVRDIEFTEKVFLALLGLVLFSPLVHPWYLLWLSAMIVIRWSPSVFLLLGLSAFSNVIVFRYRVYGEWVDDPWIVALQYVPFALVLLWEWGVRLSLIPRSNITERIKHG